MVRQLAQDFRGHKAGDVIDHYPEICWKEYAKQAGKPLEKFAPPVSKPAAPRPKGGVK